MKKCLCLVLALALLLPAFALGEEINLAGMTTEELIALKARIDDELSARSDERAAEDDYAYVDFGELSVAYNGFELIKNAGVDYLVVHMKWINQDVEPKMFLLQANVEAYQNGRELDTGYIYKMETEETTKIMPNYEGEVHLLYKLNNTADDVTIFVSYLFDFIGDYPKKQIVLKLN